MKHFQYLAIVAIVMGFTACGDDPDSISPDTGKDNTTDMVVTGGVAEKSITDAGTINVEFTGYLNLTDEMKLTMESLIEYGIEISTDEDFDYMGVCWREESQNGLKDGRSFVVSCSLDEKTKYYYRAYLSQSEYNSMKIYGKAVSFTTSGIEKFLSEYVVETPEVEDVGEHWVHFNYYYDLSDNGIRIAYDPDRSKLTEENIKNGSVAFYNAKAMQEEILEDGMTYYYCAFNILKEKYVKMGEIKSFTTKGFGFARYVKADINYDSDKWIYTANIQTSLMNSPLANDLRGKEVKYGMRVWYDTSYPNGYLVSWLESETAWIIYADGSNSKFQISVSTPFYYGTTDKNREKLDEPDLGPAFEARNYQKSIEYLEEAIEKGYATEADKEFYRDIVSELEYIKSTKVSYTHGLYDYCTVQAEVFVEVDGERYVVAKQEGPVRIPTYGDLLNILSFN